MIQKMNGSAFGPPGMGGPGMGPPGFGPPGMGGPGRHRFRSPEDMQRDIDQKLAHRFDRAMSKLDQLIYDGYGSADGCRICFSSSNRSSGDPQAMLLSSDGGSGGNKGKKRKSLGKKKFKNEMKKKIKSLMNKQLGESGGHGGQGGRRHMGHMNMYHQLLVG